MMKIGTYNPRDAGKVWTSFKKENKNNLQVPNLTFLFWNKEKFNTLN